MEGRRMGIRLSYEHCRKQDRGQGQRNRTNQHLAGAFHDPTGKTLLVTAPAMAPSGRQDHQPVGLIFAPLALQHRQPPPVQMIWIVHEQERRSEARSKWRVWLAPGWSGGGQSGAPGLVKTNRGDRHITSNVRCPRAHRDLYCHLILGRPSNGKRLAMSSAGCIPSRSQHVGCWRGCPMPVCEVLHTRQNDAAPQRCTSWPPPSETWPGT